MSGTNERVTMDLLVVITRLHAEQGSAGDEFQHGWSSPNLDQVDCGIIANAGIELGYWGKSKDHKAGVLVIHGHNKLFSKKSGDFEDKVIAYIEKTPFRQYTFSSLTILKHGDVPGILEGATTPYYSEISTKCKNLANLCPNRLAIADYSLRGKRPPSMEVSQRLIEMNIPKPLCELIEAFFDIGPAVELIVRSMQHIILEIRLWCDLLTSKKKNTTTVNIQEHLQNCHTRLNSDEYWKHWSVLKALNLLDAPIKLGSYLKHPAKNLFCQDEEGARKALYQDLFEGHGGEKFLDCKQSLNALVPFLDYGEIPEINHLKEKDEDSIPELDAGLRALSARLELLILAATAEDRNRKHAAIMDAP